MLSRTWSASLPLLFCLACTAAGGDEGRDIGGSWSGDPVLVLNGDQPALCGSTPAGQFFNVLFPEQADFRGSYTISTDSEVSAAIVLPDSRSIAASGEVVIEEFDRFVAGTVKLSAGGYELNGRFKVTNCNFVAPGTAGAAGASGDAAGASGDAGASGSDSSLAAGDGGASGSSDGTAR